MRDARGERREFRAKKQEAGTKKQEPRTKKQEPRTKICLEYKGGMSLSEACSFVTLSTAFVSLFKKR